VPVIDARDVSKSSSLVKQTYTSKTMALILSYYGTVMREGDISLLQPGELMAVDLIVHSKRLTGRRSMAQ